MKNKYVKGFDDYRKAIKEGLNIYEFEDDVQEPVADLDTETEKAEEAPSTEETPITEPETTEEPIEEPAVEEPAVEEPKEDVSEPVASNDEAKPLDFGDNGNGSMSEDELTTKLDFISGIIDEYKKLIKKGDVVDTNKIQTKIQSAFDSVS